MNIIDRLRREPVMVLTLLGQACAALASAIEAPGGITLWAAFAVVFGVFQRALVKPVSASRTDV